MFLQPRHTQTELHGYSVEFSPFVDNLIAVGTAQYFGIVGNGRQHVYEMLPAGGLAPLLTHPKACMTVRGARTMGNNW
ncbi:Peroxisomal targeting signal 2 receptor [Phytophthora megakarya]|uniref:Peroxisomal targeting signal 2 receptor n=1 Tax=Phytophthora megakarya TaxID=4795 RepID=A0A225UHT7_9STRA|nr:Peroxisomal targeting signal 2 receptor [Phytophthora megakarya]